MEIFQDENENVIEKPFIISISTLKDIQNTVSFLDNKGNVYSFESILLKVHHLMNY